MLQSVYDQWLPYWTLIAYIYVNLILKYKHVHNVCIYFVYGYN